MSVYSIILAAAHLFRRRQRLRVHEVIRDRPRCNSSSLTAASCGHERLRHHPHTHSRCIVLLLSLSYALPVHCSSSFVVIRTPGALFLVFQCMESTPLISPTPTPPHPIHRSPSIPASLRLSPLCFPPRTHRTLPFQLPLVQVLRLLYLEMPLLCLAFQWQQVAVCIALWRLLHLSVRPALLGMRGCDGDGVWTMTARSHLPPPPSLLLVVAALVLLRQLRASLPR